MGRTSPLLGEPGLGTAGSGIVRPPLATEGRLRPESLCCTEHSECGWAAVPPRPPAEGWSGPRGTCGSRGRWPSAVIFHVSEGLSEFWVLGECLSHCHGRDKLSQTRPPARLPAPHLHLVVVLQTKHLARTLFLHWEVNRRNSIGTRKCVLEFEEKSCCQGSNLSFQGVWPVCDAAKRGGVSASGTVSPRTNAPTLASLQPVGGFSGTCRGSGELPCVGMKR